MSDILEIKMEQQNLLIEKKSKFIALSLIVRDLESVKQVLSKLENMYSDATHICYAYVMDNQEKYYDDGEPTGTAGKPILSVIKSRGIKNVLVAVVRYFGGIKLGTGGLTRMYSNACSSVLDISQVILRSECTKISFKISIEEVKKVDLILHLQEVKKIERNFGEEVEIVVYVLAGKEKNVEQQLQNIFMKELEYNRSEEEYII